VSSIETTIARGVAAEAAQAWVEHRRYCPVCSCAARTRAWALLCPAGAQARAANLEAQRALAANRAEDKAPIAGQMTLFDEDIKNDITEADRPAGASGGRSFSNGNGPGAEPNTMEGWVTCPSHWWTM
jgi:hypothetical protein